jgi:hypothetical protein
MIGAKNDESENGAEPTRDIPGRVGRAAPVWPRLEEE